MGTPWIFVHHSDSSLILFQQVVHHFTLAKAVACSKWETAVVTKKEHNIFIGVTLVCEPERHDPMKSSRLKKTLAPSSTTLAVSS
jgi:hypothetical protein